MTTMEKSKTAKRVCSNYIADKMYDDSVIEVYAPLTDCTSYYAERQNVVANAVNKPEVCSKNKENCTWAANKETHSAPEVYLSEPHEIAGNECSIENYVCDKLTDAALPCTCTRLSSINTKDEEESAACNVHITRMRHEPYAVSLLKPEDSLYSANFTHVTFKPIQQTFVRKSNESNTLPSSSHEASCTVNADNKNRVLNNEVSKKSRSNGSYENSLNSPFENTRCTSEGNVSRYQQYINCPAWFQLSEANRSAYNKCKNEAMRLASYAVRDEKQNSSEIIASDENEQISKTYSNENTINVLSFRNSSGVDGEDADGNINNNDEEQEYNECNGNEQYNNANKYNICDMRETNMYNNNTNHCSTSIATNNLQNCHSQNLKADGNRNDCKHYDNSVSEVNKSHIMDEEPCYIEPIILPPSRYQVQRELQLASVNVPLTNATMDRSTYYTDNNIKRDNVNSTIDDTSNCCEVRDSFNNNNNNNGNHETNPISRICVSEELSASTSAERTAATTKSFSSSLILLSRETSPELITDYSPFLSMERSAAKIVDVIPIKSFSGLSTYSMHVPDSHTMSNINNNNNNNKNYCANESKDTANINSTKCVTTPIKNLSKIYVSGRPLPVRRSTQSRRQVVEVKVNLRHCEDDFLIADLHSMFGAQIKLTDLIGRYVLVEGDRGIDMGQITAVLKTNVVAHGDISPLGNFDLSYMESQDGSFHTNTTSQPYDNVQVNDKEVNNCYMNDDIDNSNETGHVYHNTNNDNNISFNVRESTSRNSTNEIQELTMMSDNKEEVEQIHEHDDNIMYNDGTEEQERDMYPSLDHLPIPTAEEILQEQFMPRVLREATCQDEEEMMTLTHDEVEARNYCEECLQRIHLPVPINIEDVLFQFDRKKLIVRYTSNAYVDFNVLTRTLHNRYKCRIWMDQVNRDVCEGVHDRKRHGNMHNNSNSNNYNTNSRNCSNNNNNRRNYNYSAERSGNNNNNYEHRNYFSYERAESNINNNNNTNNNSSYHHNNHHSRAYYNNNTNNNNNSNNTRYSTRRRPLRRNTRSDE